jgi:hypothetical protein
LGGTFEQRIDPAGAALATFTAGGRGACSTNSAVSSSAGRLTKLKGVTVTVDDE